MADAFTPRFVDLVRNTTTTVGTGNFTLGTAVSGFTSFAAAIKPGESFYYSCMGVDKPTEREVGRGTMQANGTISRAPVGGTLTNFSTGTKTLALIAAAEWFEKLQSDLAAVAAAPAVIPSNIKVKTPYDFGAKGANVVSSPTANTTDVASLDASPDDTDALQAFFDFAFAVENAQEYVFDWSGQWKVSKPLYFARPLVNTGTLNVEYHGRRFVCGTLHVAPVAQQPGGVAMDTVLTISGPYSHWAGHLMIHAGDRGQAGYAGRRFNRGVRVMQAAHSVIEHVSVHSAKKEAVWVDSQYEPWTVRAGTPYEAGSGSKNNIGLQIGSCVAVNCGALSAFGLATARAYSLDVTARTHGGDAGETGTFNAATASFGGSQQQRTKLTVASTAELRDGEYGLMRQEIAPAVYTSIAADNSTGMLIWTAGDPVAQGLAVGQTILLEDAAGLGLNDGVGFEILSFGGTSNREISVFPKPATEAAKAYSQLNTTLEPFRISKVLDATNFMVTPWVPDQFNSKFYLTSGGVKLSGNDGANVHFGYLAAIWCGVGLNATAMYGATIDDYLTDIVDIGIAHGVSDPSVAFGPTIGHAHFEGCTFDVIGNTLSNGHLELHANSTFGGNVRFLSARATTGSALTTTTDHPKMLLASGGFHMAPRFFANTFKGVTVDNFWLTNHPGSNKARVTAAMPTVNLDYVPLAAQLGLANADLLWSATDGSAPAGTMTIQLSSALLAKGWALTGPASISAPATPLKLEVTFNAVQKKVHVHRFDAQRQDWTPNFSGNGDVFIPAREAMTIAQGNAKIGTGTIAFQKSSAAAPGTFADAVLPVALDKGGWLKVSASGVSGFVATHLVRTA